LVNERFGVGTRRRNHETHGSGSDSHSRHSRCPNLEAEPVVEGDVPQVHRPSLVGCRHLLPVYLSDLAASHIWHNRLDDDCFWQGVLWLALPVWLLHGFGYVNPQGHACALSQFAG